MGVSHSYSLFLDLGTGVGGPGQPWGNTLRKQGRRKRKTSIAFWALVGSNLVVILVSKKGCRLRSGLSVVSGSSSDLPPSPPPPTVAKQPISRTASTRFPSLSLTTTTTTTSAFWMPTPQTNVPPDMIRSPSAFTREEDEEVVPYIVVAEIGKGSFATVYKGYHSVSPNPTHLTCSTLSNPLCQETHKQVAIKTVSRSKLTTKLFENLQSEIEILKALSHRHITRLLDIVVRPREPILLFFPESRHCIARREEHLSHYRILFRRRSHKLYQETRSG